MLSRQAIRTIRSLAVATPSRLGVLQVVREVKATRGANGPGINVQNYLVV
jgi:hypothetical protein